MQSLSEPGGIHGPRRRAYAPGGGVLQETSGAGGEGENGPGESQLSVVEELGARCVEGVAQYMVQSTYTILLSTYTSLECLGTLKVRSISNQAKLF